MTGAPATGAVVIGRNEGARLIACLDSLAAGGIGRVIYVDSGSEDGSQEAARARGAELVVLDTRLPFTAARARNAGFAQLMQAEPAPEYVQFIDGDCALDPGWIPAARAFLQDHADVAAVCGRRRERFPEASVYNRLIDQEWDTPVGAARACGGDVLMRTQALSAVGGYNPTLIAGEEPELCVRLRQAGWRIWRLGAEMTLHDAALTRLSQWWRRAQRAGHAYAEGAALHGAAPERHCVPQLKRVVLWGMILPLVTLAALLISPWAALALLLLWPLQVARLWARQRDRAAALSLTFCKLPEAQGVLTYLWRRLTKAQARLIEYK
jgi:GT2 family glycosyltransferase